MPFLIGPIIPTVFDFQLFGTFHGPLPPTGMEGFNLAWNMTAVAKHICTCLEFSRHGIIGVTYLHQVPVQVPALSAHWRYTQ
jgi:hypothetical protein